MQEIPVQSLSQEDPLEEEMATHCRIQEPEKSRGQRSLVCCSPRGRKSRTILSTSRHAYVMFVPFKASQFTVLTELHYFLSLLTIWRHMIGDSKMRKMQFLTVWFLDGRVVYFAKSVYRWIFKSELDTESHPCLWSSEGRLAGLAYFLRNTWQSRWHLIWILKDDE